MDDLLKEAIADAKAVRETALENAKIALEEAFTPRLQSMLSKKIQSEMYFNIFIPSKLHTGFIFEFPPPTAKNPYQWVKSNYFTSDFWFSKLEYKQNFRTKTVHFYIINASLIFCSSNFALKNRVWLESKKYHSQN